MPNIYKLYLDDEKNLYIKKNVYFKNEYIKTEFLFIKFENWVLYTELTRNIFNNDLTLSIFEEQIIIDDYLDNIEDLKIKEVDLTYLNNLTIQEIEKIKNENFSKLKRNYIIFWGIRKYFDENNKGKKIKLTIKINTIDYPEGYTEPNLEYNVIFDFSEDILHFEHFLYTFDSDLIKSTKAHTEKIINVELI